MRVLGLPPLAFALLLFALVVRFPLTVAMGEFDGDTYWLAAAGRWMVEHRAVITRNVFSFTAPEHPWVMHEWLFGVLYFFGKRWSPNFFVFLPILVVSLWAALLLWGTVGRARVPAVGVAVALVLFLEFGTWQASPRPFAVSSLFAIGMWLLASAEPFRGFHLVLALVLELVWANAHGSFPLGVALLGLGVLSQERERPLRILACALAALVTLVNPYGLGLHRLVAAYAHPGREHAVHWVHARLHEFQPIWEAPPEADAALVLVVIAGLGIESLLARGFRLRGMASLVLLLMAVRHVRHLELAATLGLLFLIPRIEVHASRWASPFRSLRTWVALVPILTFAAGVSTFFAIDASREDPLWAEHTDRLGGAGLPEALARVPEGARIFAPANMSGRVSWLAFERGVSTYYDTRNDCYPEDVAAEAFAIWGARWPASKILEALEARGIEYAVIRSGDRLRKEMSRRWILLHRGEGAVLFRVAN